MSTDLQLLRPYYPDLPLEDLPANLLDLLPQDKDDTAAAQRVVAAGADEVGPILPHLVMWLQDGNWPVAMELAPFLAGAGSAMVGPVRNVLASNDDTWKYWVLEAVVRRMSRKLILELADDLRRVAGQADEEEAYLSAREVLASAGLSGKIFR